MDRNGVATRLFWEFFHARWKILFLRGGEHVKWLQPMWGEIETNIRNKYWREYPPSQPYGGGVDPMPRYPDGTPFPIWYSSPPLIWYPILDRGTPTSTSHQSGILHSLIFNYFSFPQEIFTTIQQLDNLNKYISVRKRQDECYKGEKLTKTCIGKFPRPDLEENIIWVLNILWESTHFLAVCSHFLHVLPNFRLT